VSFDELTPAALLTIMYEVFHEVDSKGGEWTAEVRGSEPPAFTAQRAVQFCQVLKCPAPADEAAFRDGLAAGDKRTVYAVLAYILARLPQLKKRAYVARYLMPVEVPPEFMHDESVIVRGGGVGGAASCDAANSIPPPPLPTHTRRTR